MQLTRFNFNHVISNYRLALLVDTINNKIYLQFNLLAQFSTMEYQYLLEFVILYVQNQIPSTRHIIVATKKRFPHLGLPSLFSGITRITFIIHSNQKQIDALTILKKISHSYSQSAATQFTTIMLTIMLMRGDYVTVNYS